jgi:hypothetical protein
VPACGIPQIKGMQTDRQTAIGRDNASGQSNFGLTVNRQKKGKTKTITYNKQ